MFQIVSLLIVIIILSIMIGTNYAFLKNREK
jgi:hypothetical protein